MTPGFAGDRLPRHGALDPEIRHGDMAIFFKLTCDIEPNDRRIKSHDMGYFLNPTLDLFQTDMEIAKVVAWGFLKIDIQHLGLPI